MKHDHFCFDGQIGTPRRDPSLGVRKPRTVALLIASMVGLAGCGSADASSPSPVAYDASDATLMDGGADQELEDGADEAADDADAAMPTLVGDPVFKMHVLLDDMAWTKTPRLAAFGDVVFLVGTVGSTDPTVDGHATFREKTSGSKSFGTVASLGAARGLPENAGTSVYVEPDGAVDVAFIDQTDGANRPTTITLRRRSSDGTWNDGVAVVSDSVFRPRLAMTGSGDTLDLFWTQQERVWHTRKAGTAGFGDPSMAIDVSVATEAAATTLADGRAAFVVAADNAWTGIENGDQFVREEINGLNDGVYLVGPSLSASVDGRAYAAFHGVSGGIYVAERSTDGVWDLTKPFEDLAMGPVSVVADPYGHLHLFWANESGVSYAYRNREGVWSAATHTAICNFDYGAWGAITWGTSVVRAHLVTENTEGGADENRRVSYAMFEVAVQ